MLSIIIPCFKDKDLQRTVDGIWEKAKGDIEVIVVLDGHDQSVNNAKKILMPKHVGMRECINAGVKESNGEYIMKCDAHIMFDEGFDVKLLADIEDNWLVVPRRFKLNTDTWTVYDEPPIDYDRLVIDRPDKICGVHWSKRRIERAHIPVDETMVHQGSCYVMSRKHWDWLGGLDTEHYGELMQEAQETALKTWLGGGKVMVNKNTWYAHRHRLHGRTYRTNTDDTIRSYAYSKDFWLNNRWDKRVHDLKWLFDRFGIGYKPAL